MPEWEKVNGQGEFEPTILVTWSGHLTTAPLTVGVRRDILDLDQYNTALETHYSVVQYSYMPG